MSIVTVLATIYAFVATATADDFCRANLPTTPGAWLSVIIKNYHVWSGRWAVHGLYALTFPYLNVTSINYNLLIFLSAACWMAIFFCFIHVAFRGKLPLAQKLIFTALICCVYWAGMPDPGETWYWLTGSVEYQLPLLLIALSLAVLSSKWATESVFAVRLGAFLIGTLLAVLVTGLNEFIALFLLGALAIATALALVRGRPMLAASYAGVLVVTAAATAFNLTAPGTAVRAGLDFPNRYNLVFGVKTALLDPTATPLRWLSDARLLSLTFLLLTSPWFARLTPTWLLWPLPGPKALVRWSVVVPVAALAAVCLGTFAVAYAQGLVLPGRILNVIYAVFIVGWLASMATLAPLAAANAASPNGLTRAIQIAAGVMLAVTLLAAPNTLNAATALPHVLLKWRPAIDARDAAIRASVKAGRGDVILEPIAGRPVMLFWRDQPTDPNDWHNTCMAEFYGARSIAVRATPGSKADPPPSTP